MFCLKTIRTDHQDGIWSLKKLTPNLIASGSYRVIKIWCMITGVCQQTINAHSEWVYGIVYLSNEHMVSCSNDHKKSGI